LRLRSSSSHDHVAQVLSQWDQLIAGRAGGGALLVLAVAVVLGLRHALDPDHLVAVSTLVATERERPVRRSALLGLAWGLGHATTLIALGSIAVLARVTLPATVERIAETSIGLVIVALALRLLRRWRDGRFHAHGHAHGALVHRHLHPHGRENEHRHDHPRARSPLQAYAVGLLHGLAGSAAVTVLVLATVGSRRDAAAALVVFAAGTAASMALLSTAFGYALGRARVGEGLARATPVLGGLSLAFGVWFALQAAV
jgi:ABC-type nickel/cobalt efflux system permease component RcnA